MNTRKWILYTRLARLHQPVGIWLLFWPCAWTLMLATDGIPLGLLVVFLIGSLLMRSAGCIINDVWDSDIDAKVSRTKNRPLANGSLDRREAIKLAGILTISASFLLFFLPWKTWLIAMLALAMAGIYPSMKRFFAAPQIFLGATFTMGVWMAWFSLQDNNILPPILLYTAGVLWTFAYDTIYAHQDIADDTELGIHSSARLLHSHTRWVVGVCYALFILLLIITGIVLQCGTWFYAYTFLAAFQLAWQVSTLDLYDVSNCRVRFLSNQWVGLIIFVGILADKILL